jgi:hypothetical protein
MSLPATKSPSFFTPIQEAFTHVINNPFGLEFVVHEGHVYTPLESLINKLGYIDCLEHIIGVARIAIGLIALATLTDRNHKITAACHVFRGVLETIGTFEISLAILDLAFTIGLLAKKWIDYKPKEPAPNPAVQASA